MNFTKPQQEIKNKIDKGIEIYQINHKNTSSLHWLDDDKKVNSKVLVNLLHKLYKSDYVTELKKLVTII